MKPRFALLLMAALVAAGCATPDGGAGDGPGAGDVPDGVTPPQTVSREDARAALEAAVDNMPERFAVDMEVVVEDRPPIKFRGLFDNESDVTFLELKGNLSGLDESGMGPDLPEGMTIYTTPQGSVFLAKKSALTFPPEDEEDEAPGFGQPPKEEVEEFVFDRDEFFDEVAGDDANITSVTPTMYRGKAAVEVVAEHTAEDETFTSRVIVFLQPARLAYIETQLPSGGDEDGEGDEVFAGAVLRGDLYYGDEIEIEPSQDVVRALGLMYDSGLEVFSYPPPSNATWTFMNSAGIPLDEVAVHVKSEEGEAEEYDFSQLPTVFSMRLSEGSATSDAGVVFTFTDADEDGMVSAGDTLEIRAPDGEEMPTVILYDTVTGVYVVPGPGLLVLVALAAAVALARRRRV